MRRFFVFLSLMMLPLALMAQDTLTVMQYNLLEYGNYQSGFAECFETNNNTQRKDECIRTIMDYVKPDIFTVCEFGATQALLDDFVRHNLNINGANYWKTDNIMNYNHSNIINHIFYDSRKMELKKRSILITSPRDTDVYELYMKTSSLVAGDTIKLVCIVTHPKAGQYYESSRLATMQTVMSYIDLHYAHDNVLIMGDFNMYRASESGYQVLTQTYPNSDALFVDPLAHLGGVGEWNNNGQFAPFHTQSTRRYSDECFSSGGLDDRFDFILMSDEIFMGFNRIKYIDRSYKAIGNDGNHFDQSINQNDNSAVPTVVADALYDASDHLPVTMKLLVYDHLDVEETPVVSYRVYPNPVSDQLMVSARGPYSIVNMMGQVMKIGQLDGSGIDVSALANGLYFISVNGVVAKFVKSTVVR